MSDACARTRRAYEHYLGGHGKEAAALLIDTIKAYPTVASPYKLLADVERSLGNRSAELAVLEELVQLEPLNAASWGRLAAAYAEHGRMDDAWRTHSRASRLAPDDLTHWHGVAATALATQRFQNAQDATAQLLQRFPNSAVSHLFAGHLAKALGQVPEARASYETALSLDPACSAAIYNRVDLEPPAPDDSLTARTQKMLQQNDLGDVDLANLHFASARIFDGAQQYERAFSHYEQANGATARFSCARGVTYKPSSAEEWVATTIAQYPAKTLRRTLAPLQIDLQLIFIVGMPRSGTSLVEQILSSHPAVTALGELPIAAECESRYLRRRMQAGLRDPIDTGAPGELELLEDAREYYLDRLFEREIPTPCVVDKQPGNFARLGFLRLLFPQALFVHTRRDPIATCWSLYTANFAQHGPYYTSLSSTRHYFQCYQRLMAHWESLFGAAIEPVEYESLVREPADNIKRLLQAAHLPWEERCMNFHENIGPVLTASHRQVRQPLYTTSLERWRPFAAHLNELAPLSGGRIP